MMRRQAEARPVTVLAGAAARVGLSLAVVFLAVLSSSAPADAQQGVAVDVGRIDLDEHLRPGGSYVLPTIGVRNPGSEVTSYRIGVSALETENAAVPGSWVSVTPEGLTLDPDERQRVEPTLHIPADAAPGTYETLVAASVAGDGQGARVGAAAATRLVFEVSGRPAAPDLAGVRGGGWVLAVLLAAGLFLLARPLSRIRIRVERRP